VYQLIQAIQEAAKPKEAEQKDEWDGGCSRTCFRDW
jgi:hypothetical protein